MSADQLDDASDREQEMRDDAIAAIRRKASEQVIPAVGQCHNCCAIVPEGVSHCDKECEIDHTIRRSADAMRYSR
ncbi:hypothetical protein [Propionivibrio sp.]|uniref:hypothetical protein n=1 Tax=Propionivibrio sp. TaxID=2212460 RepID=UPI003BF2C95F